MNRQIQRHRIIARSSATQVGSALYALAIAATFCSWPCFAIIWAQFESIERYVGEPGQVDIVIALCEKKDATRSDGSGFQFFTTDVRQVICGNRKLDKLDVASTEPMEVGRLYMLRSPKGGQVNGVDFLAVGRNLSVVPVPNSFDLSLLDGKDAKQQVLEVLSRREYELDRELDPILEEKSLLDKALIGRSDNIFKSSGQAHLKSVTDFVIKAEEKGIAIDAKELPWSGSQPGKTGFLYFGPWGNGKPVWEFAKTTFRSIDELEGKPVEAVFYGRYTPGRPDANRGPDAIFVNVGDVVLVRATSNPSTVYVLDLVSQENTEILHGKYAMLSN